MYRNEDIKKIKETVLTMSESDVSRIMSSLDKNKVDEIKVLYKDRNKIIDFRRAFCLKISEFAKKAHLKISSGLEEFALKYSSSCDKLSKEVFLKSFEEDKRKGYTTVGPHRDDYIFIINNKNIQKKRNFKYFP